MNEIPHRRILIVDDEEILTRLLRMSLEQTGRFTVREENNSLNAISAAHEFKPDLIVLDVVMPDLDGGDIISRLQSDPRLKAVPVIFFTATVRKSEVDSHGGIIGGFPFLGKPVSAKELIACIDKQFAT